MVKIDTKILMVVKKVVKDITFVVVTINIKDIGDNDRCKRY